MMANQSTRQDLLFAKGFRQQQGVDFEEIFSPIVKMTTLRCVLALATREDMELVQMDVKTAFLHGDLREDIICSSQRVC